MIKIEKRYTVTLELTQAQANELADDLYQLSQVRGGGGLRVSDLLFTELHEETNDGTR
ncbi:MAG: hypothetical protein AAFV46_00095 [Cyanobacteria bacterium J06635_11]